MTESKVQVRSDTTMVSILEANAEQVLQNHKETVPSEEAKVFNSEASVRIRHCHVDDQGFVSSKIVLRRRNQKQSS